ncbi:MAG TPA: DUF3656 domain-containing protein, partial [Thermoleophilia bacterium]|nr:DUF3656 domain-containing protein [Thermoleophilia bacterium]
AVLTAARARDALGALGGTPYSLGDFEFALADGLFMAVGELKDLRRRALAELDDGRLTSRRRARRGLHSPGVRNAVPSGARERLGGQRAGVVVLLRPGELPLAASGVSALCLDLRPDDSLPAVTAAAEELQATGLPLRVRLPEILFDGDEEWWRAILALPWWGVYVRHLGVVDALCPAPPASASVLPFILEYPLQGLNSGAAQAAACLAGHAPQAVVVSPEASLDDISGLSLGTVRLEILAFGRQQLLHTRDQLGRAEGLVEPPGVAQHVALVLTDAKGYEFPASVDFGGSRLFNARVTNLAPNLDDLSAAGVRGYLVVQSDLDRAERAAFAGGGLSALAPLASRERSTTGHLFRGVA